MQTQSNRPTHTSSLPGLSGPGDGTNKQCHGFTGGVQANSKHVIDAPQVTLVLWDSIFTTNAAAANSASQLVTDLITGPFMNGLAQYGVARGGLVAAVPIDLVSYPAPSTWDVSDGNDLKQLQQWFKDKRLTPPAKDNTSQVFLIILPTTTQLTNGSTNGIPNTTIEGWHHYAKFNSDSANADLFWGVVQTLPNKLTKGSEASFINGFAYGVAHELCETFTNRDGAGYVSSNNCEIGDVCEVDTSGKLITFIYKTWSIEPYWSGWDNVCIHGDAPVRLSRFFTAINFNSASGLNALGTTVLNLDYIASRMR